MPKSNRMRSSLAVLAMRRAARASKKQRPAERLASVCLALVDYLAECDFDKEEGELWNELKNDCEEVLRGR